MLLIHLLYVYHYRIPLIIDSHSTSTSTANNLMSLGVSLIPILLSVFLFSWGRYDAKKQLKKTIASIEQSSKEAITAITKQEHIAIQMNADAFQGLLLLIEKYADYSPKNLEILKDHFRDLADVAQPYLLESGRCPRCKQRTLDKDGCTMGPFGPGRLWLKCKNCGGRFHTLDDGDY